MYVAVTLVDEEALAAVPSSATAVGEVEALRVALELSAASPPAVTLAAVDDEFAAVAFKAVALTSVAFAVAFGEAAAAERLGTGASWRSTTSMTASARTRRTTPL